MGLDMYLKTAPKVKSVEELHKMEARLSKAYFEGNHLEELAKIKKEKKYKNDIKFKIGHYPESKEDYQKYLDAGDHVDKVEIVDYVKDWRKFNALHHWFVQNVQDGVDECQTSIVPVEKLRALLMQIRDVKTKEDAEAALPTASGFFFGGTDYDEWYFQDLNNLKIFLIEFLTETDFNEKVVLYRASW